MTTTEMNSTDATGASDAARSWGEIRGDFPILSTEIEGKPLAYLDNAASSQTPRRVVDRMSRYQLEEHSNVHRGVHTLSQRATDAYEGARRRIAEFIGAEDPDHCIFTRGATEGINLVMYAWAREQLESGDNVVLTRMEHHANIVPWQLLRDERDVEIRVVPMTDRGELETDAFEELVDERTGLIGVAHVSNALGTVNPVDEIIEFGHARDVPVLVDGCQAVPHQPVDVGDLGADFYAFSGHKMNGPTGIGVLYAKQERFAEMAPFQGGGDMIKRVTFEETKFNDLPYKFEAGTPAIMPAIGLGEAAAYLSEIGMERIAEREASLLAYATEQLEAEPGVEIVGRAERKASVLSFRMPEVHPHDIGTILDTEGVAIRAGHHCAQPVMERLGIPATARASFSYYNTRDEADRLAEAIGRVRDIFG